MGVWYCANGRLATEVRRRLFEAAAANDLEALQATLAETPGAAEGVFRAKCPEGRSLLHEVVAAGAEEAALWLLKEGAAWSERQKLGASRGG